MSTENITEISDVVVKETVTMTITAPDDGLNDEVRHIAKVAEDTLKGKFDINGVGKADKDTYVTQMLTDGLTEAEITRFTGHHRNAMAGLGLGAGLAAFAFMQENPDVNVVRADIPTVGKDYYSVKVTKQRDVAGNTSYGLVQVSHELHGSGKDDPMNKVKSILGNHARQLFAKL